ncbi:MAG: hypothetical protein IJN15_03915 [Clostridia bacterium]|nr:hypothetical protein [Clostridia bacterium]
MSSSYIFGQVKVSSLKNRRENLRKICIGLEGLKESVSYAQWELPFLYKKHFDSCEFLRFNSYKTQISEKDFSSEDIALLKEFFDGAGALDCEGECERIELYKGLLKKQLDSAEEKLSNEGKLWKTVSLCMGFGIGILIL